MSKLAGEFAVIAGGSSGIGLATAKRLVTDQHFAAYPRVHLDPPLSGLSGHRIDLCSIENGVIDHDCFLRE